MDSIEKDFAKLIEGKNLTLTTLRMFETFSWLSSEDTLEQVKLNRAKLIGNGAKEVGPCAAELSVSAPKKRKLDNSAGDIKKVIDDLYK